MTQALAYDLFVVLAAGLVAATFCRWLRASSLIGYLVVGLVIGQGGFGFVVDANHEIEHLAELGVFLLLFAIGLEFSLDDLRRLGKSMLIGGSIQMSLVAIPVTLALGLFGSSWRSAAVIGTAVAFSSTVLVFRSLSEFGDTNRPSGRRAIAILLFQDAALVPLLMLLPLLVGTSETIEGLALVRLAATSIGFVVSIVVLRRVLSTLVIPWFASTRSIELILLFTLVALGGITLVAQAIQLPPAVGAFAAGLIFSGNRWTPQIDSIMLPLREVFSAVFFVSLGLLVRPSLVLDSPLELAALFVLLISLKGLAATVALRANGLPWKVSFGMGVGLSQVGEFAFFLALSGVQSNVLSPETYEKTVLLAMASLASTPLMIRWGRAWVDDSDDESELDRMNDAEPGHAVVVGAGPIGQSVVKRLQDLDRRAVVIDLSSVNLYEFDQQGIRTIAGDASDPSILKLAEAELAKIIVVAVPDDVTAKNIVTQVRKSNRNALLIVRCRYRNSTQMLLDAGADQVISEEEQASLALRKVL